MLFRLFTSTVAVLTGAIGLEITLFLFLPMAATGQSIRACSEVISDAQNRLETGRDLTVELRMSNLSRNYSDYPDNRPDDYILGLQGSATQSVLHSPQMMKEIATEIITSCESVGAVTFGRDGSGEFIRFGLLLDGSIEAFECAEGFGIEPAQRNNQRLQWRMQFCSL